MQNDEKQALSELQCEVANALVRSADHLMLLVAAQWRDEQPGNYVTFQKLVDAGQASVRLSVTLSTHDRSRQLAVVGVIDGKEYPIGWDKVWSVDGVAATH